MKANVLLMLVILLVASASCESRSGHRGGVADQLRSAQTLEKAVIIDSAIPDMDRMIKYKVKRISKGVVTFVTISKSEGVYSVNDTIFYKF